MSQLLQSPITIRTNFTPTISIDPNKRDSNPLRNGLLAILKPTLDTSLPVVGHLHLAPYGEPSGFGFLVVLLILALALFGAFKLLK